jgi:methylated-DNA-[protein]-cysteine S-methyltransferase
MMMQCMNQIGPSAYFYEMVPSRFGCLAVIWRWKHNVPSVARILLPKENQGMEDIIRQCGFDVRKKSVPPTEKLCSEIKAFLEGKPVAFSLSHLDMDSCYEFQKSVLLAEAGIPRGRVSAYGALAHRIGSPRAARAVGTALARNPFPIIIPCHRAVRSDGSLGGFGGGWKMKRALLEMEGVRFDSKGRVEKKFFF